MPTRADVGSAGYDFYSPITVGIQPQQMVIIWTDVKSLMLPDEYLQMHIRSSLGIKHGLILANATGIIDSSYFSNPDNDGNIAIPLFNTSDEVYIVEAGDKIAQGIFTKYLTTTDDVVIGQSRAGGIGSSGR